MYCRSRPQYRSDLGWILGVALARSPDRPGLHRASLTFGAAARLRLLPHTASRRQAGLSRDAPTCVQLPSACGCFHLAPQRTCTSNPGSMPGTQRLAFGPRIRRLTALTGLAARPLLATKRSTVGSG